MKNLITIIVFILIGNAILSGNVVAEIDAAENMKYGKKKSTEQHDKKRKKMKIFVVNNLNLIF